jgi:hypothetical protein
MVQAVDSVAILHSSCELWGRRVLDWTVLVLKERKIYTSE